MDQDIRFCTLDGRRIAYATVGEGPPVVFGAKWVSHLEEEWDDPRARSFYEDLAQNQRRHRQMRQERTRTLQPRSSSSSCSVTRGRSCRI